MQRRPPYTGYWHWRLSQACRHSLPCRPPRTSASPVAVAVRHRRGVRGVPRHRVRLGLVLGAVDWERPHPPERLGASPLQGQAGRGPCVLCAVQQGLIGHQEVCGYAKVALEWAYTAHEEIMRRDQTTVLVAEAEADDAAASAHPAAAEDAAAKEARRKKAAESSTSNLDDDNESLHRNEIIAYLMLVSLHRNISKMNTASGRPPPCFASGWRRYSQGTAKSTPSRCRSPTHCHPLRGAVHLEHAARDDRSRAGRA